MAGNSTERVHYTLPVSSRVEKVAERVAKQIFADIMAGGMRPGDMLDPEALLIERYQAGRASIREALWLLEMYGVLWVKIGPRGGIFVKDLRPDDFARQSVPYFEFRGGTINHLLEARLAVEPLMARLAAAAVDDDGVAELKRALETGRGAIDRSGTEWGMTSASLHELVGRLSGNVLLSLFNGALTSLFIDRVRTIYSGQDRHHAQKTHDAIVEAIIAKDADLAGRLMHDHVAEMIDRVRVLYPGLLQEVIEWR